MELNFKERTDKKITVEIKGEDHTFCNILVKELQKDENVEMAVYALDHPLTRIPTLQVVANGKSTAEKALKDAISRLRKTTDKFKSDFLKVA